MFENRVLRKIFGPKGEEVTGEWTELHNEELNDLYCSPNVILVITSGRMRWAEHVASMGNRRGANKVLVGRSDGRRPLGRHRLEWEGTIKMELQAVRLGGTDLNAVA
jgi:hypothetical protein